MSADAPGDQVFGSGTVSAELERIRAGALVALQLLVGKYRRGLQKASRRTTAREGLILHDLELRGLNAEAFRVMLHGGHVVIDDPSLYGRWIFPGSVGHRGTAPLRQPTGETCTLTMPGHFN
jgi:hypothetical protein